MCGGDGDGLRTPRFKAGRTRHCLTCLHHTPTSLPDHGYKPTATWTKERKMLVAERAREGRLLERYGITLTEYWQLYDHQNGRCAICARTPRKHLEVDHDHALEAEGLPPRETVRGLLCRSCNGRLLPTVRDNPDTLTSAVEYLLKPPAVEFLAGTAGAGQPRE